MEGKGGTILYDLPFARILGNRPVWPSMTVDREDNPFATAFYHASDAVPLADIELALQSVEAVTKEVQRLMSQLPRSAQDRLVVPRGDSWWRTVFHLAWHFPRPFLQASRKRLLTRDGQSYGQVDETFVQLYGTANQRDLLPGLIYSNLEHDIRISSEAAIDAVTEALRSCQEFTMPTASPDRNLAHKQQPLFRQLRTEFRAGIGPPLGIECKLLKLADSFEAPPATEWAALQVGGCVERFLWLSRLNDLQEICQIRGPATEWYCELAARAGNALPAEIPDYPILFDDVRSNEGGIQIGMRGPCPVMHRGPAERWVGFVFATLKKHAHPALSICWLTQLGPLSYGLATLDRDLFAASVLAIDLVGLADQPTAAPSDLPTPKGEMMAGRTQEKVKVLYFAANPNGTLQLALDEEAREIEAKIRAAEHRDSLELITKWAVRPDDLLQFLNQHRPHVVHFSGHGSNASEIILLDRDRQPKPVSCQALTGLFRALKGNIRVVFLNACFSQPQAEAIVQEIDFAVGMSRAVGDRAAITFAASFYRALGFGNTVQNAFDQARVALMLENIPEEATPQLLVKPGVDPSQVILLNRQ
jgi:hypothetical protein